MRLATLASAMKAMTSSRPLQLGRSRTSMAKAFRSSSAKGARSRGRGRRAAAYDQGGASPSRVLAGLVTPRSGPLRIRTGFATS